MKNWSKHIAIFLTLLVLITNLSFSMGLAFCHCKKQYQFTFSKENSCCKLKKTNCSQKATSHKSGIQFSKTCCEQLTHHYLLDQDFQEKLTVNLQYSPSLRIIPIYANNFAYTLKKYKHEQYASFSNKAPPKAGRVLLNWLQVYRC